MTTGPVPTLERMIPLFCAERFLYDYLDDAKLLSRLNRVMRRVKLPPAAAGVSRRFCPRRDGACPGGAMS